MIYPFFGASFFREPSILSQIVTHKWVNRFIQKGIDYYVSVLYTCPVTICSRMLA